MGLAALPVAVPLVELLVALEPLLLLLRGQRVLAGAVAGIAAEARRLAVVELAVALVSAAFAMGTWPSCAWVAAASTASSWAGTSAGSWAASSMVSLGVPLPGRRLETGQVQVEAVEDEVLAVLGIGTAAVGGEEWPLSSATTLPMTRARNAAYVDDNAGKIDKAD